MERLNWHKQVLCPFSYFLFLFFLFLCGCPPSTSSPIPSSANTTRYYLCPPEQSFALLQFKNTVTVDSEPDPFCFNIYSPKTTSWTEGSDCCSWDGVECDNVTGNVIGIDLGCSSLQGTVEDNSTLFHLSHLQRLNLAYNNFNGSQISPQFGRFTELKYLNLSCSLFNGLVPSEISHLSKLTSLDLSSCSSGSLSIDQQIFYSLAVNLTRLIVLKLQIMDMSSVKPFSLLNLSSSMTVLDLAATGIQGKFPEETFHLPNLQELYLFMNEGLTGYLPKSNRSSHLRVLDLTFTNFKGVIPDSIGNLKFLEVLSIRGCNFTKSIPSSIFELVNLTTLSLSSNNLSGTVKFERLSKLKNLRVLDFSNNSLLSFSSSACVNCTMPNLEQLTFSLCSISEFPSFLSTSKNLWLLDLSNNRIGGGIAKSKSEGWKSLTYLNLSNNFLTNIGQHPWKNIRTLDLQNNMIQGSILVPPPSAQVFLMSTNKLTGQIPSSICDLGSLSFFGLSNNSLSGKIPSCLGKLSRSLVMLHLRGNNLQGSIPDTFVNGSSLTSLDLSDNKLEGPLPRSLVNSSQLEVINVGNNKIVDTFPCWLGTLPDLKILVLRSNRFYGHLCDSKTTFPFHNLRIMDLAHNQFTGFLPRKIFAGMEAMMNAHKGESGAQYMDGTYYHDSVNVTMKGGVRTLDRILTIFTSIDLSRNGFRGEIPEVLGNFKSLLVLNLSRNKLTGNIPLSLANLTALESIDLSFNQLDGRIPEQLVSVTTVEVLNFSYNRLSGSIPRGNQFNTFGNDSFIGNQGLCGDPLQVKCGNDAAGEPPSSVSDEEVDTTTRFDWRTAMMGYASGLVIGLSIGYTVFSTGKPRWFVRMVERNRQIKRFRRPCSQFN